MTPADLFLPKLSKVKALSPGRWKARWVACCPAHDDKNPSLYIAENPDSRLLIHCHSHGCPVPNIVEAVGLDLKDLYPAQDNYRSFYPKPRTQGPTYDEFILDVARGMRDRGERLTKAELMKEQEAFLRVSARA